MIGSETTSTTTGAIMVNCVSISCRVFLISLIVYPVLFECIDEATDYINNLYFEKLNETVEAIKANGVTFTEATAEQSAEMSSIVKPVVEDYLINNCQFTADEMDAFFAELAK